MSEPQKGRIRPNTFPSPNEHVDEAMEMLTSDEYKVLSFVVRHTWGWQIDQKAISLNTFLNGYSRYRGVGLSRTTVIKCLGELSRMKFLIPIGKADADGQVWAIGLDPDLEALELRYLASKSKRQDQMNPVRAKRSKKAVYVTDQQSTAQTENGLQHRPEVVYAIDTIKDNLKRQDKEKESPAKKSSDQKPTSAPIGDSLSGDDAAIKGGALLEEAFGEDSGFVKAEDSGSQPGDSQSDEKPRLPVSALAAQQLAADAKPAASTVRKPLMEAVCYAFKEPYGSFPAKVGQWFLGRLKKKGDGWFEWQPDVSTTPDLVPQQIISFTLWYSGQEKYRDSFVKQGHSMPQTPSLLRDHWDKYMARPQNVHDHWMSKAAPILEALMRGETVLPSEATAPASGANTVGRVEAAESYQAYDKAADSAYASRASGDEPTDEQLDSLLGVNREQV
jgi:hypothetical protein